MIKALLVCAAVLVATTNVSRAQVPDPPAEAPAPRPWQSLTVEQRQVLEKYQNHWSDLPVERQQSLARGS